MTTTALPLDLPAELIDGDLADDLAASALALARVFHAGGTLWVVSPAWEPHAHHVAVEFVHPVVVGARALPSVALTGADPVGQARVAVRPGDAVLVVAEAGDPVVRDLLRRVPAWGARSWWIGAGARPVQGAADHVLWVDSEDPMVPATGRFVLLYHLLWELTHICFEHPGLLRVEPEVCAVPGADGSCTTCSDEGRLGEVVDAPTDLLEPAWVRTATGEEEVDVTLVGEVRPGDLVLVHAGSAITRLDREVAP